jgi:dolichol-phosphate mannosyltransferase
VNPPPRALIVTPTYNERANLERFVGEVRSAAPHADLLIVDDASPDATGEVADQLAARDPQIHVMHRAGKMGLGTAYVDGFRWGLARDYAQLFEMDADLSHQPKYLAAFFRALEEGADVVVGSRNIPGGAVEGWGLGRLALSKGGSAYSRVVLGVPIRDLTTGFKGFKRAVLEQLDLDTVRSNGYSFQIEMTYRALRRGFRVVEVPIVFVDRTAGQSKMSRRIFVEAVGVVWKLRAEALLGRA